MRFLRLGTAGMRGKSGAGLTPQMVIDFASAFGTYLEGGKIVVAIDTRISSGMLGHAVVSALLSCGCKVFWAGIAPAPTVHFLIPHLQADGGLLLGGGHQAAGWNAIVPLSGEGAYLNSIQNQELLDIYHSRKYDLRRWNGMGKITEISSALLHSYFDMLCKVVDAEAVKARNFTVIADFCNGSGSVLAGEFAARFGLNLIPINNILSGILPHDPEPRPRNCFQVQAIMSPLKADAGFVFNSDMSRTAVVSNSGETLSEEYSLPLVADYVLSKKKRPQAVVTNACSTRTLDDIVARHKGLLYRTRVGQACIIDRMLSENALLAGEGSGSTAIRGGVKGFDAFLTTAMILEAAAVRKCTIDELVGMLPRYHIVKKVINCSSAHAYALIRDMRQRLPDAKVTEEDGFRFEWPDGWVSLRASNTEPVIRMIVEWKTQEEAIDRALHIRGLLERMLADET